MPESKTDQVKVAVKAYVLHFLLKLQTYKSSLLRHLTVVGQMLHLLYMVYCETLKGMRW